MNLPLLLLFASFVVTFLVTRTITRLIRSGRGPFRDNVASSGVHVHHAVPGVIVLTVGAFLAVGAGGAAGWAEVAGVLVGIGTSLVLDEFALILRLDDVYWAEEGRVSVRLVALAAACLGLALVGGSPVALDDKHGARIFVVSLVASAAHLGIVVIAILKGKYVLGLVGAFVPFLSLVGAVRLARPGCWWARRRYDEEKLARATARADRHDARWGPLTRRVGDLVAGSPSPTPTASG